MIKRMILLSAALMLSLAFAMPSHAGSVIVDASFNAVGGTATDVEIALNPPTGDTLTYVSVSSHNLTIMGTPTYAGGELTVDFARSAGGSFEVVLSGTTDGIVGLGNYGLTGTLGTITSSGLDVSVTSVPEPSSIALLGIGLSGFIAFRRRFSKKLPVA
jgi:hypothetical protein